jgi:hypothetical protein
MLDRQITVNTVSSFLTGLELAEEFAEREARTGI